MTVYVAKFITYWFCRPYQGERQASVLLINNIRRILDKKDSRQNTNLYVSIKFHD